LDAASGSVGFEYFGSMLSFTGSLVIFLQDWNRGFGAKTGLLWLVFGIFVFHVFLVDQISL
jgi:hypothetical protein